MKIKHNKNQTIKVTIEDLLPKNNTCWHADVSVDVDLAEQYVQEHRVIRFEEWGKFTPEEVQKLNIGVHLFVAVATWIQEHEKYLVEQAAEEENDAAEAAYEEYYDAKREEQRLGD